MLEPPPLQNERIIECLTQAYRLDITQIIFLPLGADPNTAVYRTVAQDSTTFFVKLRSGPFDEIAVLLPALLSDQGVTQIIQPVATSTGQLWAQLTPFTVIVYPFVTGDNGYSVRLSAEQWHDFGRAFKQIHTTILPPTLYQHLPREEYAPQWREIVKQFLLRIDNDTYEDPVSAQLAGFLQEKRTIILDLVERAERHAQTLQIQDLEYVICHSDIHAGNLLIDANQQLYIVDWDNPILAPKERDLMFIGGGQGFRGYSLQEEQQLFYSGYGPTQINLPALAYYRYERIIQDIAAFCEQILLSNDGDEDRQQALHYLMSNFQPDSTIEIAYASDTAF